MTETDQPATAVDATAVDAVKAEMIRLATEQAWDEGRKCEHCDGSGTVPGGDRIIHSQAGGFGADWNLEGVVEAIRDAVEVQWVDGYGHDLATQAPDGRVVRFAVRRPVWSGESL